MVLIDDLFYQIVFSLWLLILIFFFYIWFISFSLIGTFASKYLKNNGDTETQPTETVLKTETKTFTAIEISTLLENYENTKDTIITEWRKQQIIKFFPSSETTEKQAVQLIKQQSNKHYKFF